MSRTFLAFALLLGAGSVVAGDLHGRVDCKGARSSADAVVYVTADGPAPSAPAAHVQIKQLNLLFHPRVLPVLVGTTVDFLNQDPVLHNVFSPDACAGRFNLGTWPKGTMRSYTFKKECVATILCNVHPEMEAFIVALPTPYFGVTAADGSYRIPSVPDGPHSVKVWHPKLKGVTKSIAVKGPTVADFELHP